ncbi:hypothetical protein FBQ96_15025 [Nitrospirales bacterium NOB]|jgi:hypothetical protein|nr:MAG: hypothetical protein EDM74_10035 [Armatimonadota bacterium]MCW5937369.1 hypothetical protein [Fimbriimonadaceae bacterium]MDL1890858.1 hypothetical protein [Nitrospirales bacterium NOB]QYK56430.1 MAG: hypothetical protein KF733_02895 [Fimbriimonadaceae bacterium]
MNIINRISKSLALFAVIGALGLSTIASAHEGDCPYCKMKLVQNTKEQDNEVVLKTGNKRIEYRCMYCVIKDQGRYQSDLIVYAPSEKVGEPVVLKRTGGKWTAPEGTVFLNTFKKHADCAALSRAFSSKAAFDAYVAKHKVEGAKALTLAEFIAAVAKPAN